MLLEIAAILFIRINEIPPELIMRCDIFTDRFLRNKDFFDYPLFFLQRKVVITALPYNVFREVYALKPLLDPRVYTQKFHNTSFNPQGVQHIEIHVFFDDGT